MTSIDPKQEALLDELLKDYADPQARKIQARTKVQ